LTGCWWSNGANRACGSYFDTTDLLAAGAVEANERDAMRHRERAHEKAVFMEIPSAMGEAFRIRAARVEHRSMPCERRRVTMTNGTRIDADCQR
jgi:hypothetical protein